MYETVLERFPRLVFGEFTGVRSMFETFLGQRICLLCWRDRKRGTGMKAQAMVGHPFQNYDIVYVGFLFGRGPNRVMETACFDANVQ